MADVNNTINSVNATIPVLEPLVSSMHGILDMLTWLLGGIFGLYILFSVIKLYEFRALKKMINNLDAKLDRIEKKLDKGKKK
ncbi:MAG: hypothetical protein ACOCQX_01620 [Candidatus Nanoarchaeia archaeon]